MKNLKTTLRPLALLIFSAMGMLAAHGENKPTVETQPIRSTFILPAGAKEGRDPFYPESNRTFEAVQATSKTVEITSLKVPGISGTPGHLLAIINNHTFAVGDEGDVLTTSGKIHLRCLDINSDSVLVEINGHSHRIKLEMSSEPQE